MKRSTKFACILTVAISAFSLFTLPLFHTTRLQVPPPAADAKVSPELFERTSNIQIEFRARLAALEKLLNEEIQREFALDPIGGTVVDPTDIATDDTIEWQVTLGHLDLAAAGDAIAFEAPFEGRAVFKGRIGVKQRNEGLLGYLEEAAGIAVTRRPEFAGTIRGTARPRFNADWTVDPGLAIEVKLSKAEVELFGEEVKVSFRSAIEGEVRSAGSAISRKLNAEIAASARLKSEAQNGWDALHVVAPLDESPRMWLSLRPVSLHASNVSIADEHAILTLSAKINSSVHFGGDEPRVERSPLPPLIPIEEPGGALALVVPVVMSFSELRDISPAALGIARDLETSAGAVTIEKVFLMGSEGKLVLGAEVIASVGWFDKIRATLYLSGTPVIDRNTNTLRFDELSYDLRTKNALIGAADGLLESAILSELRQIAVFDLSDVEARVLAKVESEIAKFKASLPAGVHFDFELADVGLYDVAVDKNRLVVVVHATGLASLRLEELEGLMTRL